MLYLVSIVSLLFVSAASSTRSEFAFALSRAWLWAAKDQGLYHGQIDLKPPEYKNDRARDQSSRVPEAVSFVETTSGVVIGTTESEVHVFYGIPYAQPPTGNLRFQPPIAFHSTETIDASINNRLKCIQFERACLFPLLPGRKEDCENINMKEDCLVLNIYVPKHINLANSSFPPESQLAVMFYIHGGSFNSGAGYGVDGRELAAAANVIVVTINYRLGPFGFLVNKENDKPDINGNQGLKDQQFALQWVQDNIEYFGGDKSRVTIFGGSAGAQSVMFHTLTQKSAPFYWNAILQSDPAFIEFHSPEESQKITDWLVKGLCGDSTDSNYNCLMNADAIELSNLLIPTMARAFLDRDVYTISEAFRPVIDGIDFKKQPLDLYAAGEWNSDKNMIIGVQSEELDDVEYFIPEAVPTGEFIFTAVNYYIFSIGTTDAIVKKYSESYPPDDGDYISTFGRELTHFYFVCPSRALARLAAESTTKGAKVFFYVNSYPVLDGTCRDRNNGSDEGCYLSSHGDETRFVMRTKSNPSISDVQIENQFTTYWGNFARTGNPNDQLQTSLGDFTEWPVYTTTPESPSWRNIRFKAPMSELEQDYEENICNFWDSIGLYMEPVPLPSTIPTPVVDVTELTSKITSALTTSAGSIQRIEGSFTGLLFAEMLYVISTLY